MDDAVKLPNAKLDMLRLLLKDPKISQCIVVDGVYAGEIIVKENGDIMLGKTKMGWINRLFNAYKELDFLTIAMRIAAVITGSIAKSNRAEWVGMLEEIFDKVCFTNNREQIIDLLFQWVVLFDQESIYASKYIQGKPTIDSSPASIRLGGVALDIGTENIWIPVSLDKPK